MKKRQGIKNLDTWWADREEDLLAEIARLRGALRACAEQTRMIAGHAEVNLVMTPKDMSE